MKFIILVSWVGLPIGIVSLRLSHGGVDFPCSIIAEAVHQTVFHGRKDIVVNPVPIFPNIVFFFDMWIHATTNPDHPQEFIDVIPWVPWNTSIDHQNVVHIQPVTNFVSLILRGRHSQPYCRYMGVVPCIVVNQSCPIGKARYLIPIIPPRHNDWFRLCVHS